MKVYSYHTIETLTEGLYIEKGSKFISYAIPILSEEDVKSILLKFQKQHPKSRHICYAYCLGINQKKYRAYDDGEPNGSAGLPLLNSIYSKDVSDVLVVVIRYFGGTKLGKSGLTSAYKVSALEAMEKVTLIKRTLKTSLTVTCPISKYHEVIAQLKTWKVEILNEAFAEDCTIQFKAPLELKEIIETTFISFQVN